MTISPGETGRCPHCRVGVRFEQLTLHGSANFGLQPRVRFDTPTGHKIEIGPAGCPECGKPILVTTRLFDGSGVQTSVGALLWPDTTERPVPAEVEAQSPQIAADFREAVAVFSKSKKASAALARRCLQSVLVAKGGAKARDLAAQIDEVLSSLPPELAHNVDAIRHVGNFAAHPLKSTSTGQIIDVEEGEAEWLLEVLEELFAHYYVVPARAAARRAALNKKLQDVGKPPLKTP